LINYNLKYVNRESEILELRHKNQETSQGSSSPRAAVLKWWGDGRRKVCVLYI